jgi:mono/diheme cytochrome c family protein
VDNGTHTNAPLASVQLGPDGSMAAIVPARRALSWQLTDTNDVGVVRERYWLTFQPGEIRTCASCHGVNTKDQANHFAPTNTPAALIALLNYWKTNSAAQPAVAASQGTNFSQVAFVRRPGESGVTYHVQASSNLVAWADIATYAGTNRVLTTDAMEVSRTGSPNERIVVRATEPLGSSVTRFLRVRVTSP